MSLETNEIRVSYEGSAIILSFDADGVIDAVYDGKTKDEIPYSPEVIEQLQDKFEREMFEANLEAEREADEWHRHINCLTDSNLYRGTV